MAKPNLNMVGRTAGSPDNAQGTHFFLINDSGTYFLRKLPPADGDPSRPRRAAGPGGEAKVQLLDHRIDVPDGNRDFPAYLDSNRFLSNLPGTTILFPVVDLSQQYINGMMYLLTQPDGARPTIVDDRNFYRSAGVKKWVKNGFLNKDIKLPLGAIWAMRTQIEADLLLQNLMLTADSMGLGAWIHASIAPPVLLGRPEIQQAVRPDAGLRLGRSRVEADRRRCAGTCRCRGLPTCAPTPVGLRHKGEHLIKGDVPAELRQHGRRRSTRWSPTKFGPDGIYSDESAVRADLQGRVRRAVPRGGQQLLRRRDRLHARHLHLHLRDARPLPGPCETIHVPGVWLQAHHVEQEYYERYFRHGLTEAHRASRSRLARGRRRAATYGHIVLSTAARRAPALAICSFFSRSCSAL